MTPLQSVAIAAGAFACPWSQADEPKPPKAARSVHLAYEAASAAAFTAEVVVERSTPGSFFMVCGFSRGYFGLQELSNGKKLIIFSVWDPTQGDNPKDVPPEKRVEVLFKADDVLVKRFGGEGTGGQSFFNFDWKLGAAYRFCVRAVVEGDKTAYSAHFLVPDKNEWKHLVTFRTATGKGGGLRGLYSFVEDFRRDTKSATEARRAAFGDAWTFDAAGAATRIAKARFTASGATWEAKDTIDAGVADGRFYLQTGGDTKTLNALRSMLTLPASNTAAPAVPKP